MLCLPTAPADVHGSGSSDASPGTPRSQPPSTDAAVQQQAAAAVGGAKNGALPEKQWTSRGSFLHNLSNLPHAFTMSLRCAKGHSCCTVGLPVIHSIAIPSAGPCLLFLGLPAVILRGWLTLR